MKDNVYYIYKADAFSVQPGETAEPLDVRIGRATQFALRLYRSSKYRAIPLDYCAYKASLRFGCDVEPIEQGMRADIDARAMGG